MSKLSVDQAIEEAAESLPEGYVIEVNVESGAAWVNTYGPDGSDIELPECVDGTLAEQIQSAIEHAVWLDSE
ncbi:hypothetical protein [Herbaspirillum sp.]|jgi:hypothetical protein|uniref:hypothetical protein n=1 Tax=Herbaspirillum sp. TaxID=1890675 RepID=UPI000C0A94E2|nr:hypothetical protein [Herbaspirillum sp.]MAF06194.1 hypothetical protein [Herbaspirillum sp.]|tara:strand:+ start:12962 stop:13177 length:216 start_codon:yes stop_codon:yes gene_type:complete